MKKIKIMPAPALFVDILNTISEPAAIWLDVDSLDVFETVGVVPVLLSDNSTAFETAAVAAALIVAKRGDPSGEDDPDSDSGSGFSKDFSGEIS